MRSRMARASPTKPLLVSPLDRYSATGDRFRALNRAGYRRELGTTRLTMSRLTASEVRGYDHPWSQINF